MPDTENLQRHLAVLEDALVGEFRTYQTMVALTQDERQALLSNNLVRLQEVVAQKEALLGNLERLESARQAALQAWVAAAGVEAQTLVEILPSLEAAASERLMRLRDGILALTTQMRELAHGNQALADSALEGVAAVHNFLLSLSQVNTGYQRPGAPPNVSPSIALAVEHRV
jgi:flagellar biosynthesis/type III secretory pathway chaperone